MEFLLGLLVGLAAIALVGHGIWVAVRATLRGLSSLVGGVGVGGRGERPIKAEMCPRCGETWDARQRPWRCEVCAWSPYGDRDSARPRPEVALARLRLRVERYARLGLLAPEIRDRLVRAIQPEAGTPAALTPAAEARPAVTGPAAAPVAAPIRPAPEPFAPPIDRVAPTAELPERARAYREFLGGKAAAPAPAVPAEPVMQRVFRLLSAFLEEKSIRWGELVGGLLIVGCSLALVISFWSSIAERPLLKYVLFNGVTAMLFGLGIHAERRWKLPTTALGLLIIATLLTPLNFLAVASLVRGAPAETIWSLGGELVALGVFAALVYRAGRSLVGSAPWTLAAGVLLPSASMLLVRRSVAPGGIALALAGLPWLAHAVATGGWMARSRREPEIGEEGAAEGLRLLGPITFAATLALGLVLVHSRPIAEAAHRLTPLAPLAGASILAPGLWLWRRVNAKDLVGYRTAGTAIAAAGTLILLAGLVLAWPTPARMLPVALLDFAVLAAIAVAFRVPAAHALAGMCLALAGLLGWAVGAGKLAWQGVRPDQAAEVLLSAGSGAALVPIVLAFGVAAAALVRAGRRADAQAYAMVAGLAAAVSLGLVTWLGFGRVGDPEGVTVVYAAYAAMATLFAVVFARSSLVEGKTCRAEISVLGWLGSGLLLAALVQGLVYGGIRFHPPLPGIVALLTHATAMAAAGLVATYRGKPGESDNSASPAPKAAPGVGIVSRIFDRSALAASFAAGCGLAIAAVVRGDAASALASDGLWVSALWMSLAWRHASPALFGAGQAAMTGAVVFAVAARLGREGWYVRSPLPWLDPRTIQAQGLALGVLCLGWIAARLAVRKMVPQTLPTPGRLIDPTWPAFDRYVRGAVVAMAVGLALYAALPGAAQELTPRDLAVQIQGYALAWRVVPPIAAFEVPGLPHTPASGIASWALCGLAIAVLLAGQWERPRRADLLAALAVATMAAPLAASRWESSVAVASAWRWSGAIALLAGSCLIWGRGRLARWADRFGWRFDPEVVGALHGPAVGTVLGLGMLPLAAMGLYVGAAALSGRTLSDEVAWSWTVVGGLFVALGATSLGLRGVGDRRAWARPAGSLLAVMGTLPLVAVTVFAVSSALAGNPIVGPEPGSTFHRIGQAGSYVPPILLVAATLVGFAVREKSSGFAFAAGLAMNLAATVGFLMVGARGGLRFDASLWTRLAQINAIVAAGTSLAWIGALATGRRRRGDDGPAPADGLLATSLALGVALNLLVLLAGTSGLFIDPMPAPAHRFIAAPLGLFALAMTALAVVGWSWSRGRPIAPDWLGLSLLCVADLAAMGLSYRDAGDWLAHHGMIAGLAAAGFALPLLAWHRAGLRSEAVGDDARSAVSRWGTLALIGVVLFAIRGYWSDPQSPWWTVGGLAAMGALAAVLASWSARVGFLRLAATLWNLAATFWWVSRTAWPSSSLGALADLVNVNIISLALPAPLWLWIEGRMPWESRSRRGPFQGVAAWSALGVLALVVISGLGDDAVGAWSHSSAILGWSAIAATAVAMGCGLWDRSAKAPIAGLYLLGLCASGWAVVQFHLPPRWLAWTGTMVLAAYSVGTSYLWCRRDALRALADRVGIPRPDGDDPAAGLSWLVPANLALAAGVLALAFGTILADPDLPMRSSAAHAALAEGLAIGLLARGARRSRLQAIALGVGVAGAVAWGWAWIAPGSPTAMLDRLAVVLAATVGGAALYGLGLSKLLRKETDWTLAAQRLVPALLGLSGVILVVLLGVELFERSGGHAIPMAAPAVAAVALALVGAAVAALVAAVVPGRDPLGLSERGRTAYVYGCEVLIVALGMHLRLAMPWLFSGFFARYWPLILLGVAFVGVGLGELFRRQGRLVLAEPLERTGALLPAFPLLAAFWMAPKPGEDVVFLALVGALYTTLSVMRSSLGFGTLAALACNGAIWAWLGHREGLGLFQHPQVWVIPPALCVLVGAYLNRDRLSASQSAGVRMAASLAIYVASTADILLTGVAQAPWLPAVLAALSIAGIFAGILLRIRGFLFLGLGFLSLSLFSIIWYAAVDLRQTWLWAASGVVVGVAILAVFALFEKKRQEVLSLVGQLKEWEA